MEYLRPMQKYQHGHNPGGVLKRGIWGLRRYRYRRERTATKYFEGERIRKGGGRGHGSSIVESSKEYLRTGEDVSWGLKKNNSGQNGRHAGHKTGTNRYPLGSEGGLWGRRRTRVEQWAQVVAKGGYIWTGNDRKQTVVYTIGIEMDVLIKYYGSESLLMDGTIYGVVYGLLSVIVYIRPQPCPPRDIV